MRLTPKEREFSIKVDGSKMLPLQNAHMVILSGDGTSESKDLYKDILNEDDRLS